MNNEEMTNNINDIEKMIENQHLSMFQDLVRLANPSIDKDLSNYDTSTQDLIFNFTRIFNLEQLLYILKEYNPNISNIKTIIKQLTNINNSLKQNFIKFFGNTFLDGLDIYSLMTSEIDNNFINAKGKSLLYKIHKIGIIAFQIEKNFKINEWNTKKTYLKKHIIIKNFGKKKYKEYCDKLKQKEAMWNNFESEYQEFVNAFNEEDITPNDSELFYELNTKKDVVPITHTDKVIRNTITFRGYLLNNKNTRVAKTFDALFANYSNAVDLRSAGLHLIAGHICYFRLMNIAKLLIMIDECGMDCMYNREDMAEILGEPLANASVNVENLTCMDANKAYGMLENDANALFGETDLWSHPENLQLLFCMYLELEKEWLLYEAEKTKSLAITVVDKLYLKIIISNSKKIEGFYNQFAERIKYNETLNKLEGKVIEF